MDTLAAVACAEQSTDGALLDLFVDLKASLEDTKTALARAQSTIEYLKDTQTDAQTMYRNALEENKALRDLNTMLKAENALLHNTLKKSLKT